MPSNEEIAAALRVLVEACDMRCGTPDANDMPWIARAMLNAAELIRLAKLEGEIAKMSHPDEAG